MEHNIESTPQHIGPTGCAIQSIVAMTKRMLEAKTLMRYLWAEVVANTICTLNRYPTKALRSVTPEEMWSRRRPCVAHIRVFRNLAYVMVSDEKRFNAKGTKCMFLGYCEGMKAYRLVCLATEKIRKGEDVVIMEDSGCMKNKLEMRPSGRNGGHMVVVVDEASKPPWFDGGGQFVEGNERVGGNGVAIEEPRERLTKNDIIVESFDEER